MNPVLQKDLIGLLRLKRVAAMLLFFVAVLGLLVIATWPQGGVMEGSLGIGAASVIRSNDYLLLGLVIGQIALLVLFVPGVASVALCGEREANTLEMLYASRLRPGEIVLGKMAIAISYPLLLLIAGVPFAAMLFWRGDVTPSDLAWSYIILLITALLLAMISLAISAVVHQSATALVIAYVTIITLSGVLLVPASIMLESQSGLAADVLHYARSLSPVAAALSLLKPQPNDFDGSRHQLLSIWQVFIPASLAVIAACFALVAARLAKAPSSDRGYGAIGGTSEHRSLGRRLMYLIDPKKKHKPFGRFNPVATKERRTNHLRSGQWMIRIFYGALFLSLSLSAMSIYGGVEYKDLLTYVANIVVAFQIGIIALVVPSLTSAAISSEFENDTFETLRLSRLSGGQIFWGKFLPAFIPAILPVLAIVPAYAALWYVDNGYLARFLLIGPIVLLSVIFCCTLGLMVSSFSANTARATVTTYLIAAAIYVVPVFAWWAMGQQLTAGTAKWIAFISPLVMSLTLLPSTDTTQNIMQQMYWPHLYLTIGLCIAMLIIARTRLSYLLRRG